MSTEATHAQGEIRVEHLREALRVGLAVVTELWSYGANDWVSSVHAADIDGDGDLEVLISSRDNKVHVLTNRGGPKWQFEQSTEWVGTVFGIDNFAASDDVRVVAGSRDNTVYALDKTGKLLWKYATGMVIRQILVQDINADGKAEVIAGSEDHFIYVIACETGKLLWRYPTDGWIRALCAADIDGDGEVEILAGSGDTYLYVLDSKGQLRWKHATENRIYALFARDIDGDGVVEILVGSDAKDLRALTPDLREKWKFTPTNRVLSIFVADLNNDGHLEVIAGSEDNHIYILDDQGRVLWKHNLWHRVFSVHVIDLDHDGILEILAATEDDSVHVLRVELTGNLYDKIISFHEILKRSAAKELKFSSTEETLLRDITGIDGLYGHDVLLEQAEQVLKSGQYLEALSILLLLEQRKVQRLWAKQIGHVRSVCIGDLVKSAQQEIVLGTHEGRVYVLNVTGEELWSYALSDQERIWTVQISDIDSDGAAEVIIGSANGCVYALSNTGEDVKWQACSKDKEWITSITIMEPAQDRPFEMIMGVKGKEGKVRIFDEHLSLSAELLKTPQGVRVATATDIDGDGAIEVIAGTDDYGVYAYKRDGKQLWTKKTFDRVRGLSVGDIDNDDRPEIIVGSEDRNVYVFDGAGHQKWLYYTPHRVLDVTTVDVNKDGNVEVLIGDGDGSIYVLSGEGDLLWEHRVNDRVRVVRASDLDRDGNIEIVIASEDTVYFLRVLDQQHISRLIEQCWEGLLQSDPMQDMVYELAQHQDPHLRAFALKKLAASPNLLEKDFDLLRTLLTDRSKEVRWEFARRVGSLYQAYPDRMRRFLDLLSADRERDVRLAFMDGLPDVIKVNQEVGFEYLDRFTKNIDRWVRRAVVRKLYYLAREYPQQVFRLLLITAQDKADWVRQESARSLARYFDVHSDKLIIGTRSLIAQGIDFSAMKLIEYYTTNEVVRNVFHVFYDLFYDLDETNVESRLHDAAEAFEKTSPQLYGKEMWQLYHELYRLHRMHTIHEIARYKFTVDRVHLKNIAYFEETLDILERLNWIVNILKIYQKREGLGDRLASLLEAITTIEGILTEIRKDKSRLSEQKSMFSDRLILDLLLTNWRAIISAELARLRDKARITPELQTKAVRREEQVAIWLCIHNEGHSPADHMRVELLRGKSFEIVGDAIVEIEEVPSRGEVTAEFIIRPKRNSLHLEFKIFYGDAEARDKVLPFGDHVNLFETRSEFKPINNPYTSGTPVHDADMFYGREDDLQFLKENLTNTSNNIVVVLYGQRRSGKTSLLYQLVNTPLLEPHIPIYIDMQNEAYKITASTLLRSMAFAIHRELKRRNIVMERPGIKDFDVDPTFSFNLFLDDAEALLGKRKLVILIDEFEVLEQKVKEHALDPEIFEYFRSLMQHRHRVNFLVAGTHSIEQLTADYWSVFFNIARHHRLRRLSADAAAQLIVQPVKGYLEYDSFAVRKIRQLTADQPYLIHLVCRSLVEHANLLQKSYMTINDVNVVLDGVIETGKTHFGWIWDQISLEERLVLSVIAQEGKQEGGMVSLTEIEDTFKHFGLAFNRKRVIQAVQNLIDKDVIISGPDGTQYKVLMGLTHLWLQKNKSLGRVMLEENLLPE
jgi:outer membrane protein assembly factor BamB/AAA+ ATPase superfamily predicted ATPase